ncbi:MAG: phosphatase PAP2 family protein [Elusimicrobiota bacterium]
MKKTLICCLYMIASIFSITQSYAWDIAAENLFFVQENEGINKHVIPKVPVQPAQTQLKWYDYWLLPGLTFSNLPQQLSSHGFALSTLTTAALMRNNKTVFNTFDLNLRNDTITAVSPYITFLGDGWFHLGLASGLYTLGMVTGNDREKLTARMMTEAILLSGIQVNELKIITGYNRPFQPVHMGIDDTYPFRNDSFPSGHTSNIFSVATVLSEVYGTPWLYYTIAVLTGISRMYQHSHWPADVVAGAVLGHAAGRHVLQSHGIKPGENTVLDGWNFRSRWEAGTSQSYTSGSACFEAKQKYGFGTANFCSIFTKTWGDSLDTEIYFAYGKTIDPDQGKERYLTLLEPYLNNDMFVSSIKLEHKTSDDIVTGVKVAVNDIEYEPHEMVYQQVINNIVFEPFCTIYKTSPVNLQLSAFYNYDDDLAWRNKTAGGARIAATYNKNRVYANLSGSVLYYNIDTDWLSNPFWKIGYDLAGRADYNFPTGTVLGAKGKYAVSYDYDSFNTVLELKQHISDSLSIKLSHQVLYYNYKGIIAAIYIPSQTFNTTALTFIFEF